jgi:hypothetical protein
MPLLDTPVSLEHCLQVPVVNDEYGQWMYIEMMPGFIEKTLGTQSYGASERKSKRSKVEEKGFVNMSDCVTAFRVFENAASSSWLLVVQTTHLTPGSHGDVTFIASLDAKEPENQNGMVKMEVGSRLYLRQVSRSSTNMNHFDQGTGCFLKNYKEVAACVTKTELISRLFSGGASTSSVSAIESSKPILLLPYNYQKVDEEDRMGSFMAVVQSWGVQDMPKSFEIIKAIATIPLDEKLHDTLPCPFQLSSYSTLIDDDDATDSLFD